MRFRSASHRPPPTGPLVDVEQEDPFQVVEAGTDSGGPLDRLHDDDSRPGAEEKKKKGKKK